MTSDAARSGRENPPDPDQGNRGEGNSGGGGPDQGNPDERDADGGRAEPPDPGSDPAKSDLASRSYRFLAAGSILLGLLIALADLASAWVIVALPLTVAVMVAYDDTIKKMLGAGEARIRCTDDERPLSGAPPD